MSFVTPQALSCRRELTEQFPGIKFGVYNRRHINRDPNKPWSQHSWPNALDIFFTKYGDKSPDHQALLDAVNRWLRDNADRLGIRVLLWRVTAHYDHIHVDFWPMGYGTPSVTRGGADNRYKTQDGQIITQAELEEGEDDMGFDYTPPEDLTQDGEVFNTAWEWALENGLANEFTQPTDIVEKQEMFVFLYRYAKAFKVLANAVEDHGHAPGGLILPEGEGV